MPITKERALTPLFLKNAAVGFHCDGGGLYLSARPLKAGDGVTRSSASSVIAGRAGCAIWV